MTRVVELAPLFAGPLVGHLLVQGGCKVTKVEPPQGDPVRRLPPIVDGEGFLHRRINADKETLRLDLKTSGGRDALRSLVAEADVVIDGNRPGVLEKWMEPDKAAQDGKVVLRLSGHGQHSLLAKERGHDLTYAAHAGVVALQEGPLAIPAADVAGAMWGVAQVWRQLALGTGAVLDVSLTGCARLMAALPTWMEAAGGQNDVFGAVPWYGVYDCSDGRIAIGALEPDLWAKAARVLELAPESSTSAIAERLRMLPMHRVLTDLRSAGVGAAPVQPGKVSHWGADDPKVAL